MGGSKIRQKAGSRHDCKPKPQILKVDPDKRRERRIIRPRLALLHGNSHFRFFNARACELRTLPFVFA